MQQPQHDNPQRLLRPAPARAAYREARRRKRLSLTAGGFAAAAAAVMAVSAITGGLRQREAVEAAAASDIEGVQSLPAQGGAEPGDDSRYHRLAGQACRPHSVPVDNELGLHALRHGAVWVTYHPNLPAGEVGSLKNLASEYDAVLLTPSAGPGEPVTARAWNVRLDLPSADDERIEPFILKYANSPRRPEASASCTARD